MEDDSISSVDLSTFFINSFPISWNQKNHEKDSIKHQVTRWKETSSELLDEVL
jgi:hypothetical protein